MYQRLSYSMWQQNVLTILAEVVEPLKIYCLSKKLQYIFHHLDLPDRADAHVNLKVDMSV